MGLDCLWLPSVTCELHGACHIFNSQIVFPSFPTNTSSKFTLRLPVSSAQPTPGRQKNYNNETSRRGSCLPLWPHLCHWSPGTWAPQLFLISCLLRELGSRALRSLLWAPLHTGWEQGKPWPVEISGFWDIRILLLWEFNSEVWKWKKVTEVRALQSRALDISPLLDMVLMLWLSLYFGELQFPCL